MDRSSSGSGRAEARARLRKVIAMTSFLASLAAACSRGQTLTRPPSPAPTSAPATLPSSSPATRPTGPLAGLSWPAGSIHAGMLLHDDGTRLWSVPLHGSPEALWRHPAAGVYEIAAAPDGSSLAYSVQLPLQSAEDPSYVLYLLDSDGSIETVDVVDDFRSIETPMFLRAPTDPKGPVRLYWIRGSQDVSTETGRLETQVMMLGPGGPEPVAVPLRYDEAPFEIHGYPGAATFALTIFRSNNVPTRLEILHNRDLYRHAQAASLTLWANNEAGPDTDVLTGVAWVSPIEYVVPVGKEGFERGYSLSMYVFDCEWAGSVEVYVGTDIDWGLAGNPWPILPGGRDRVLVLGAEDMANIRARRSTKIPWLAVDLRTGSITPTDAMWSRGPGWWTFVQPDLGPGVPVKSSQFPDCSMWDWTYP